LKKLKFIHESISDNLLKSFLTDLSSILKDSQNLIGKYVKIKSIGQTERVEDIDVNINSIKKISPNSCDTAVLVINGRVSDWKIELDKTSLINFLNGIEVKAGNQLLKIA
jgi:hypothetical protein